MQKMNWVETAWIIVSNIYRVDVVQMMKIPILAVQRFHCPKMKSHHTCWFCIVQINRNWWQLNAPLWHFIPSLLDVLIISSLILDRLPETQSFFFLLPGYSEWHDVGRDYSKIELTNSPDDLSLNKNIISKCVETFVSAKSICCFLVFAVPSTNCSWPKKTAPAVVIVIWSFVWANKIKSIYLYMRLGLSLFAFSSCILIFRFSCCRTDADTSFFFSLRKH